MAFFVGDLVVSVSGCSLDERAGPMSLVDPFVELSVGNKLHSTSLPIESFNSKGKGYFQDMATERCMIFRRVTERDVLSITVLDRAASTAQDDREDYSYMAEAEPLLCTHWGVGGRTARRVCAVAAPEAVLGFGAKVTAVQLTVSWAPEMRLKKPFSLVAAAGGCTRTLLSSKLDGPVGAAIDLALYLTTRTDGILESPRRKPWRRLPFVASLVGLLIGLSLGSVWLLAVSLFFLPITIAVVVLALLASLMAPLVFAVTWALACTTPAREKLWRPLIVWTGTRSRLVRRLLLLPVGDRVYLREEAIMQGGVGYEANDLGRGMALAAEGRHDSPGNDGFGEDEDVDFGGGSDAGAEVMESNVGAVVLLLTCYQNMMGVLHTGLEASRWRPRARKADRR
ncbi:unnamed protein product [Ascophyllum nodosum]